jgi:gliding motility-associated-like protein
VNSECSGTFVGATHCPDDTTVKIVAPYGYLAYTWYDSSMTNVVGDAQTLTLTPPPAPGTVYAVKLVPYTGYGCPLTMYSKVMDTLVVQANAGEDQLVCNDALVQIGALPKAGLIYNWTPQTGLSNSNISNPLVRPDTTTTFILTTRTVGGGCTDTDTVVVKSARIDKTIVLEGSAELCTGTSDSAILKVQPVDRIEWFRNSIQISNYTQPVLRVTESGSYHAILQNVFGCIVNTEPQVIDIASIPVAELALNLQTQCLVNNQFVFNNASTNVMGTMKYKWFFGDGSISTSRNITHSYTRPGNYNVKLIVNSNAVCADTAEIPVTVFQNPVADFAIEPVCVDLPFAPVNKTADTLGSQLSYLWDFGDGQTSTEREPPSRIFNKGGVYPISLSVSSEQCPFPQNTKKLNLLIDQPRKPLRLPVQYAVINHPATLRSRQFGESILWSPGNFLNSNSSYSPIFNGSSDQLYTITITTATGCVTVDTLFVKSIKDVNILVPTAFTPNNDGKNDFLKPVFMGIERIRHFRIFNRWGQLLFEMNGENRGWDGMLNGVPQPTQTVVWMVEGIGVDGNTYLKKGTSTLIR